MFNRTTDKFNSQICRTFLLTHNAFVSGLSGQLHAADESYFTDIKNDVNTGFKNMFIFAVNFSGNNFALKRP